MPVGAIGAAEKGLCALFNLVFPDNCRVCEQPLHKVSRIPVCDSCLRAPEPAVADYFCVACRTPFLNRSPLDDSGRCTLCRLGLAGFDAVYTFGAYEGVMRRLIRLFKFSKIQTLARPLGSFLRRALPIDESYDLIVPMPLHWRRRWHRGFNQADLLAHEIARRSQTPVRNIVRRRRATTAQAGLTNSKRRANVQGAFRIKRGLRLDGQRVLLVDDVFTTGATAAACARALKRAGAAHVTLLAVARTDRRELLSYQPDLHFERTDVPRSLFADQNVTSAGAGL